MQTIGMTGKIYGLKAGQTQNGKDKVSFRLGIRKSFVSDQDKQEGKTQTFVPIMIMGPTAKFVTTYFKDGDAISLGEMEYQTFRSQNADPSNSFDDRHMFRANKAAFVPGSDANSGGGAQQGGNAGGYQQNQQQAQNNQGGGYNQSPQQNQQQQSQQPDPFANGNGYVPDDDLPF